MAGTVAEWYEFFLYGMAAALVFGDVFFKATGNPLDGVIAALLTYAIGFVARPIGGIIFGHYGDKFGRKKLLQVSLLVIGVSTFLIGAIPSFDQIGYAAPIILVVLRFMQGIAIGGEWGGAVLLVAEQSPDDKRGFWASFPQVGAPLGNVLATVVLLVLSFALPEAAFLSWGWRVAFFFSAFIVLIGWFIRTKVEDSPIFKDAAEEQPQAESTWKAIKRVFQARPREVLTAMGARVIENILYYMVVTFSLTYLKVQLDVDTSTILTLMLISHIVHAAMILVFGWMSDKVGRRPVYLAGATLATVYCFVAFPLMDTKSDALILCAITVGLIIHAVMYAPQPALLSEMFPTHMRYIGVSLGAQVTAIFAGSLAPVIATMLLRTFDSWVPIAIYVAVAGLISIVAVLFMRETKGTSLAALDDEHRARFGTSL
ncbi:MHS family MFS transporter [Prescottella equi]|nr:MFS transporter [Prescottella equi]MBU4616798.1 MHS family MFS transporter [Rhodococcus sp. GG48]MCD7053768.1 MHS family MFS transporter [Rhodococcus sp. BH2-1]MBM9838175.1 MHS family MFS transporter [Prescottella equi]MCU7528521.1 MHS family MFS transporter [Prescottella equi]MCU7535376.1 MHS family MFS transporter [Prescottella equi]